MKNKGMALGWVLVYVAIAVALQFVMGFIWTGVVYKIGIAEGLVHSPEAMARLLEEGAGMVAGDGGEASMGGATAIAVTALNDFVMLAGFGLWYYFRESKYPFRPNYRKAFTATNVLAVLGIAVFGQFAVNLVLIAAQLGFPKIFEEYAELSKSFELDTITPAVMIFIVCILGPLAEEMLFRGMIYAKLRRAFSLWPAAAISGLLFGVFHLNWVQGIYATVIGVVLAYVYERTQTIWGSCLLHVLFNASSYVIDSLQGYLENLDSAIVGILMLAVDVASAAIVVLLMRVLSAPRRPHS